MNRISTVTIFSALLSLMISCSSDVYVNANRSIDGYRLFTTGELTGAPDELKADIHAAVIGFLESAGMKRVDGAKIDTLPLEEIATLLYYDVNIETFTNSEVSLTFSLKDVTGVTILSKSTFLRRSYAARVQMLTEALENAFSRINSLSDGFSEAGADRNYAFITELISGRLKSEYNKDSLPGSNTDFYNQTEDIEGYWYLPEWRYKILIAEKPEKPKNYLGLVTESSTPLWRENDLKCDIQSTVSENLYEIKIYDNQNSIKKYTGRINKDGFRLSLLNSKGEVEKELVKTFPGNYSLNYYSYFDKTPRRTLSGVLINRSGLVVCSSYETDKEDFVKVLLPGKQKPADAEIIINSKEDDLMLVMIGDFDYEEYYSYDRPYFLTEDNYTDKDEAVIIEAEFYNRSLGYDLYDCRVTGRSENGFVIDNKQGTDLNLIDHPVFTSAGEFIGFVDMSKDEHTYHRLTAERNKLNDVIKMTGNAEELFKTKSSFEEAVELYRDIKEYVLLVMIYEGR